MVSKARLIASQIEKRARFIVDRLIDFKLENLIFFNITQSKLLIIIVFNFLVL